MHCGTSWPDVGFPAAGCSEVEALVIQLESTTSHICLDWRACFCFPQSFFLNFQGSFAPDSFSLFSLRVLKYWTYLWPSKSFDSFFVIKAPPWPILYFSLNWLRIFTVSFKIMWSLEPPASFSYLISTNQRFLEVGLWRTLSSCPLHQYDFPEGPCDSCWPSLTPSPNSCEFFPQKMMSSQRLGSFQLWFMVHPFLRSTSCAKGVGSHKSFSSSVAHCHCPVTGPLHL